MWSLGCSIQTRAQTVVQYFLQLYTVLVELFQTIVQYFLQLYIRKMGLTDMVDRRSLGPMLSVLVSVHPSIPWRWISACPLPQERMRHDWSS